MKIDLDITALNVISSSLKNVTLKGEDAVAFAKVITKVVVTLIDRVIARVSDTVVHVH